MTTLAAVAIVALLLLLVILTELCAAALPIIIVITLVPRDERQCLAQVIAAIDSSRRLRLWPALRAAVAVRKAIRTQR